MVPLCEVNLYFPSRFAPINLANRVLQCMGKLLARIEREMWINFALCISVTDEVKINEQNKSIATDPLRIHRI